MWNRAPSPARGTKDGARRCGGEVVCLEVVALTMMLRGHELLRRLLLSDSLQPL